MKSIEVKGTARTANGKKAARELRKQGIIPCNLYGEAKDEKGLPVAFSFSATQDELRKLVYSPDIYSVDLNIDGKVCKAVMRELQFHPVKDNCLHIDFLAVDEKKPIKIDVPVVITGHAVGVQQGGKFFQNARKLKISAVMDKLPDTLPIDITKLGLDKKIKASDVKVDGITIVSDKDTVICGVQSTRNSVATETEESAE